MATRVSLDDVSDGRLYDITHMVKADTGGCDGCSACCHGVGELVELTPFDAYVIVRHLDIPFDGLLGEHLELRLGDKILLPHLRMIGEEERCSFLDKNDRCSIHGFRPNICRLFPLGRVYDQDNFKYILQVGACTKSHLGKIKVKKWIGIQNYAANKEFILAWHQLLKALAFRLKFIRDEGELKVIQEDLLDTFYRMPAEVDDFYMEFFKRLPEAKKRLGIL